MRGSQGSGGPGEALFSGQKLKGGSGAGFQVMEIKR